jgi:Uma2 family endonuclease
MELSKLKEKLSLNEYLKIQHSIPYRHEFIDGFIVKLENTSANHSVIIQNLSYLIRTHLKEKPCRVFTESVAIDLGQSQPEPDLFINCEKLSKKNCRFNEAILIVEVLSKQTRVWDSGGKFELYKQIPSFREYALIEQDKKHIIIYRKSEDGTWQGTHYMFDMEVPFNSIALAINIDDIYEDVEF